MFVDQLWLNLAPTLFPADVAVSRSRLINVGYWNFHERSLDEVALFHWSRARVSPFGEEHRVVWSPELAARIDARVAAYLRRLAGAAERAPRAAPAFGAFTDGRPITWLDRREFSRGALRGIERPFARADAFAEAAHERTRAARRARLAAWRRRLLGI